MTSNTIDSDETMARGPPVEIPGYEVQGLIASGGMGDVYLAIDVNLRRRVAIKFINAELSRDPVYKKRFEREAQIVAGFRHENIVRIYSSGYRDGRQYMVMEYVSGGTLEQKMAEARLTKRSAAKVAEQMAAALAYAHDRGVVHRDFKPGNVLLDEEGTPLLSDFGVAKSNTTSYNSSTAVGAIVGNPRYMAPEQARGEVISDRADTYALGLVLYEMLVGDLPQARPIRAKHDEEIICKRLEKHFAEIVVKCLREIPSDRLSASECRDRLKPLTSVGEVQRSWRLLALSGVAVLALSAGVIFVTRLEMWPRDPPRIPQAISLNVSKLPVNARIFIDNAPLGSKSINVSPGFHDVVAIAPMYYGEIRHEDFSDPKVVTASENFTLDPVRLPTYDEQQRFLKLADKPELTVDEVQSISERTLIVALRAKLLRQAARTEELQALENDVSKLRQLGDARSAVAHVLIDSVKSGHFAGAEADEPLIEASRSGDAMASFLLAVAYRETMSSSDDPIARSDPRLQAYCQRMARAVTQGWTEVASEYWRRDRCAELPTSGL
jgi:serine/threonine protein kinase